jgi:hypothetical protein
MRTVAQAAARLVGVAQLRIELAGQLRAALMVTVAAGRADHA